MTNEFIVAETIRKVVLRLTSIFLLAVLVGGGLGVALTGCTLLEPQRDIAVLCTQIQDRNAGVICVKAAYTAVADAAELVKDRYEAGAISKRGAQAILERLVEINDAVEIAEVAVFAGQYGDAEDRLNVVIALLSALEEGLK